MKRVSGLMRALAFSAILAAPVLAEDPPRVLLHDLYLQTRNGSNGTAASLRDPGTNTFVVIGTTVPSTGDEEGARWYLTGQMGSCCAYFPIGVPLHGTNQFEEGAWLAVRGRWGKTGADWTRPVLKSKGKNIYLGGDDLGIFMDSTRPASEVVFSNNVYGVLSGQSIFREAIDRAGLARELQVSPALTVLEPHDLAFQDVELPVDRVRLRHFLYGHMIQGQLMSDDVRKTRRITMLNGDEHGVQMVNGSLRIGDSRLLFKNNRARNGVVHTILPSLPVSAYRPSKDRVATPGGAWADRFDPLGLPASDPAPARP